jgi:hypothetical protein
MGGRLAPEYAQMVIGIFLAVLYFVPSVSNLAKIASALVSVVGIGLAIFVGVVSFKRMYAYLRREIAKRDILK